MNDGKPMDDPTRRKRRGCLLKSLFIFLLLIYGFAQFIYFAVGRHDSHPILIAMEKAEGLRLPKYGYRWPLDKPEFEKPTCKGREGKELSYSLCLNIKPISFYAGCSWWRFEPCLVLQAEEYLLSRPDKLGPALNALHDPCRYLPTPREIDNNEYLKTDESGKNSYKGDYEEMSCHTDKKGFTGKIVINFVNQHGKTVARYVKPAT